MPTHALGPSQEGYKLTPADLQHAGEALAHLVLATDVPALGLELQSGL